ncbi:MAG: ATP synthase F0 subunit C [Terriglobia bacterium]
MKRNALMILGSCIGLLLSAPAFAQTLPGGEGGGDDAKWVFITAGFAMAIASGVCAYAQSKATAAACEGLARNPALVLIESMALYTFAMIFIKVKLG